MSLRVCDTWVGQGWKKGWQVGWETSFAHHEVCQGCSWWLCTLRVSVETEDPPHLTVLSAWKARHGSELWGSGTTDLSRPFPRPSVSRALSRGPCSVGGEEEAWVSRDFTTESPSCWLWAIHSDFSYKKKDFIMLLGLSGTIWAGFPHLVFTSKSGRTYLASPSPTTPQPRRGERGEVSCVVWGRKRVWGLFCSAQGGPHGREGAVNGFYPQIPLYADYVWKPGTRGRSVAWVVCGELTLIGGFLCARRYFNCFMLMHPFKAHNPVRGELSSLPFSGQRNGGPESHLPKTPQGGAKTGYGVCLHLKTRHRLSVCRWLF